MATPPFEVLSQSELRQRSSVKWSLDEPDVLPLWVAEMDVLPAPEVVEALVRAVRTGDTGYPGPGNRYVEALADFAQRRWGWSPDPAASTVCADVMSGIRALVEAVVGPGGTVVVPSPVYPPFAMFTRELGRLASQVPLTAAGRLDVPAIEAALRAGSAGSAPGSRSAVLLCSPHNPTGVVHTRAELIAVAEAADRVGAVVIVDEVHGPLVPEPAQFVPWLSVVDSGFVVTSAAKAFNLPGLKAGVILAGAADRAVLDRLPESVGYGASHLGVVAHSAAWRADPTWLDSVNANIAANREVLAQLLAEQLPAVVHHVPAATYLAWLDFRALGLGDDPAEPILQRARVRLTSGPAFGPGGRGHARLNLACSRQVLTQAVARIAAIGD